MVTLLFLKGFLAEENVISMFLIQYTKVADLFFLHNLEAAVEWHT